MSNTEARRDLERGSGWARGGILFASTIMILTGVFQVFQGLAAIINDEFYVVIQDYAYDVDITGWGWIHLILGAFVALTGMFLLSGSAVAGAIAMGLAGFSALANFFFIPYYPFWALLIIALDVFVIWAIVRSGFFSSSRARTTF